LKPFKEKEKNKTPNKVKVTLEGASSFKITDAFDFIF
jgi:hypothetical protein